jgi:hypothetical protein
LTYPLLAASAGALLAACAAIALIRLLWRRRMVHRILLLAKDTAWVARTIEADLAERQQDNLLRRLSARTRVPAARARTTLRRTSLLAVLSSRRLARAGKQTRHDHWEMVRLRSEIDARMARSARS